MYGIVSPREQSRIRRLEKMASQPFIKSEVPTGEEICSKRLLHGLERVKKEAVNPERIQPFLPAALEALEHLTKEQVIERFLSLEFHNMLEYYAEATDVNAKGNGDSGRRRDGAMVELEDIGVGVQVVVEESRRSDRRSGDSHRKGGFGGGGEGVKDSILLRCEINQTVYRVIPNAAKRACVICSKAYA